MNYGSTQPSAVPGKISGTLDNLGELHGQLFSLRNRLSSLNCALHGPRPEEANKIAEQPPASVSAWVEAIARTVAACQDEVHIAEKSLGL